MRPETSEATVESSAATVVAYSEEFDHDKFDNGWYHPNKAELRQYTYIGLYT